MDAEQEVRFEITPQLRQIHGRGNRVAITGYSENGDHIGAVGIMRDDPQRGPVVVITKPVSPEGLLAIARHLIEYANDWRRPEPRHAIQPAGSTEESMPPAAADPATDVEVDAGPELRVFPDPEDSA